MRAVLPIAVVTLACSSSAPPETAVPSVAPAAAEVVSGPLSGERILADAVRLCAPELAGRGSYQAGGVKAADLLVREFSELGYDVTRQDVGAGAQNILAVRKGSTSAKAVIVSAHYDHLGIGAGGEVFLGADDNASGTAVLLAIARVFAAEKTDRTLVFAAFGAEEAGLVGSGVYVQNPTVPIRDTVAVVNFDMVGRNFFESGADTPDTAAVVGLDEVDGARAVALAQAKTSGLALIEAPPKLLELFRLENRTDDWWFRRLRVPAIHFSTGLHDDYHQVTDTPDKLVASQMEKIAVVATEIVRFLARE